MIVMLKVSISIAVSTVSGLIVYVVTTAASGLAVAPRLVLAGTVALAVAVLAFFLSRKSATSKPGLQIGSKIRSGGDTNIENVSIDGQVSTGIFFSDIKAKNNVNIKDSKIDGSPKDAE